MSTKCETCNQTTEYQGWKNYETWAVNLHLGNDQGLYNAALELAARQYEHNFERADAFKEFTEEVVGELGGIAGDLLTAALSRVDWEAVADSWKEENQ